MNHLQLTFASISLAVLASTFGCNNDAQIMEGGKSADAGSGEHVHSDGSTHQDHSVEGHAHAPGPHGGTIADWGGGKFHVEFTVDHDKQQATAYVFGPDEKTPTPINAKNVTLTIEEPSLTTLLKPSPQDGDPEGMSSRFVGTDERLGVVRGYAGFLSGVIEGTPYSGNFEEEAHDR